ncbi:MAG TPA: cytochrome c biogenesis protein ResB, partial [Candidatus Limnocylindrales bacterium]
MVQIIILATLGAIGMTLEQLPDFAFRSVGDYTAAMESIHARYDPVIGEAAVDVLERLGAFAMFRSFWFSAALVVLVISIVVCTLDRTPRLWRGVSEVRVAQPEPFFDPRLPDRAEMRGVTPADVRAAFRKRGFRVREATTEDGAAYVYGDRHQYTKMATLLTHAGLITFLLAAAVTARLGDEQGLVVAEGESLTV